MSNIDKIFTKEELECYLKNQSCHQNNWSLLRKIFYFCHNKIRCNFIGKLDACLTIQLIYLMEMADCLRMIQTASILGYPNQAAILCASLWERAHTIIYFSHTPQDVEAYIEATQVLEKRMPNLLQKKWREICNVNVAYIWPHLKGKELEKWQNAEFKEYEQLCKIKHAHPYQINVVKRVDEIGIEIGYGPYDYNDRRFDLMEAAREMLLAMQCIVATTQNDNLKKGFADLVKEWGAVCQKELSAQSIPGSSPSRG